MYKKLSVLLFTAITTILFTYLNRVQPHYYIDEIFHVPQAIRYCAGNLTQWDPKITTLPGLYLLTALILSPINLCSTTYIRCTSLCGTFANLYLVYNILNEIHGGKTKQRWNDATKLIVAYNITLLPPLFFWHFLYYTDVISVSVVLLMVLLHLRKCFKLATITGFFAVLVRQTNIIWLALLIVERALDLLETKMQKSDVYKNFNSPGYLKLLWKQLEGELSHGWVSFVKFVTWMCGNLCPYLTVCLMFLIFLIWNKGIVVGDRTAHAPTVHIPQFLYFSLFTLTFSWPYIIVHWKKYLNFIHKHWILGGVMFGLLTVIVHTNTLVHPYVLADNRHYVFYFWNKFMGRYVMFKYLLIPVYSFVIYAMLYNMNHLRFATQINYLLMTFVVLVPQLLLEPRYFITPYILYRLNIQKPKRWQIIMESLTTLVVNVLQFFVFTNKVFYWPNSPDPQRISW